MESSKKKIVKIVAILSFALCLVLALLGHYGLFPNYKEKLLGTYVNNGINKIRFINVNDGNSIIIESGEEKAIIDFGGINDGGDLLLKALRKYRLTNIKYAFITSCDVYHLGGFIKTAETIKINKVIMPNILNFKDMGSVTALTVKEKILNDYNYKTAKTNQCYYVGDFKIEVMYYNSNAASFNNRNVVFKISCNNHTLLYGGNFGKGIMLELLKTNKNIKSDILLLPGFSNTSSWNIDFFKNVQPKYIVSSS